jgi:hypothetical protein
MHLLVTLNMQEITKNHFLSYGVIECIDLKPILAKTKAPPILTNLHNKIHHNSIFMLACTYASCELLLGLNRKFQHFLGTSLSLD